MSLYCVKKSLPGTSKPHVQVVEDLSLRGINFRSLPVRDFFVCSSINSRTKCNTSLGSESSMSAPRCAKWISSELGSSSFSLLANRPSAFGAASPVRSRIGKRGDGNPVSKRQAQSIRSHKMRCRKPDFAVSFGLAGRKAVGTPKRRIQIGRSHGKSRNNASTNRDT